MIFETGGGGREVESGRIEFGSGKIRLEPNDVAAEVVGWSAHDTEPTEDRAEIAIKRNVERPVSVFGDSCHLDDLCSIGERTRQVNFSGCVHGDSTVAVSTG